MPRRCRKLTDEVATLAARVEEHLKRDGGVMEVRPGIEQARQRDTPVDWGLRQVSSMGEVITGKALAVNGPGQQRPYLRTKNVFDGRIEIDDVLTMPMTDAQFSQFQLRHGDVLLNEGQSLDLVGRCALYQDEYPEACAIQNQLLRFRARTGVSSVFAAHLFRYSQQTGVFARVALQTTSIAHLGGKRFERLLLAWPPTEDEQRAIAQALSDVDALLGGLGRLIAKKRDLKQAAMQRLLTGQTRLPGCRSEWVVKRLGDEIADLVAGVSVNSVAGDVEGEASNLAILKTSAVADGTFDPMEAKIIAPADLHRVRLTPRAETVLISRMNTIDLVGECGYVKDDIPNRFIPDRLWMTCFRAGAELSAKWLSFVLSMSATRLLLKSIAAGTSGSMKNISKSAFLNLEFRMPDLAEQSAIATVLSDMDAELAALETRRDKTRALKQAMMQSLLTGKIRLV